MNPCIKTGLTVKIPSYGSVFQGDLFRYHKTLIVHCIPRPFMPYDWANADLVTDVPKAVVLEFIDSVLVIADMDHCIITQELFDYIWKWNQDLTKNDFKEVI
jgi:hypothetical protein